MKFPPVSQADENGLLAIGGDLDLETLKEAYLHGIFPWPISVELPLAWFSPDPRGILPTDQFVVNRTLQKSLNSNKYTFKMNTCFDRVIRSCALHHEFYKKGDCETWITPEMIDGYNLLFDNGLAYSAELYNENNFLVGGVYGVKFNNFYSGESMFFLESNASKITLYHLINHLKANNIPFLDIQMVTPTTEKLGGIEISRDQFLRDIKSLLI